MAPKRKTTGGEKPVVKSSKKKTTIQRYYQKLTKKLMRERSARRPVPIKGCRRQKYWRTEGKGATKTKGTE
jgi:hypothetical protein